MKLAVIGTGYVGLVAGARHAGHGHPLQAERGEEPELAGVAGHPGGAVHRVAADLVAIPIADASVGGRVGQWRRRGDPQGQEASVVPGVIVLVVLADELEVGPEQVARFLDPPTPPAFLFARAYRPCVRRDRAVQYHVQRLQVVRNRR
jgi:hypothetical protein